MKYLSIHLTDICNSNCIFCVVDSPHCKIDSVESQRVLRFLRKNSNKGYQAVNLHGGEPTIRPDFFKILEEIRHLNYPTVWLQTNGRSLASMKFAKRVADGGVSLFIISMHGADATTQDGISRSPGSFNQAVRGIRNVKALETRVRINTVVCKQNYTQLPKIIDFVLDLGVDHVNISALHTAGTAFRNFEMVTPTYIEIQPFVFAAIERVLAAKKVLTLEGFPYCTVPGYEKYMIDWSTEKFKMLYHTYVFEDYALFMNQQARVKDRRCKQCVFDNVCGGVYKEYIQYIGWEEFHSVPQSALQACKEPAQIE